MTGSPLVRRAGAEAAGAYALVTAGCGAIVTDTRTEALGHVGVALAFGLVIMVMIAAVGHISGAHFNPAVTIAFALARHSPWRDVPAYVGAQLLGAVAGALTLRALFRDAGSLDVTILAGSAWQSLGLEILLTAMLMFVITSVATDSRAVGEVAAVAIGGTVALGALWGGPVSGASMNPARSFGPALVAGAWDAHWLYWLGPLAGVGIGAFAYGWVRGSGRAALPAEHESRRERVAAPGLARER